MPQYAEDLPNKCPPDDAEDKSWDALYRAVPDKHVSAEHFASKAANGEKPSPLDDPCRFSSCSMYTAPRPAEKMLQYPRYQNGSVVKLKISVGSGMSKKKKQHVDFWAFRNFDFLTAVEDKD